MSNSDEDRFARLHPQPTKPTELKTNKELTDALEALETKLGEQDRANGKQRIHVTALYVIITLALLVLAIIGFKAFSAPKPVAATAPPTEQLTNALNQVATLTARGKTRDSLMTVLGKDITELKAKVADQDNMIGTYGGRVDAVQTTLDKLDFSGVVPRKPGK